MPCFGASPKLKVEHKEYVITDLKSYYTDGTDQTVDSQTYAEKYSRTLTATDLMKLYGIRSVVVMRYKIKTDPAVGTVKVRTKVNGGDTIETTGLTVASGDQYHVHTEITDFSLPITLSLEGANSDAGQTSVIDYCYFIWQIGTKSVTHVEIMRITNKPSVVFQLKRMHFQSIKTVAIAYCYVKSDMPITITSGQFWSASGGNNDSSYTSWAGAGLAFGVESYISIIGATDAATDPMILNALYYARTYQ